MQDFYRTLIRLRRTEPDLADPWLPHLGVEFDENRRWIVMRRGAVAIAANLGAESVEVTVTGDLLARWGDPEVGADATTLPPHTVVVLRQSPRRHHGEVVVARLPGRHEAAGGYDTPPVVSALSLTQTFPRPCPRSAPGPGGWVW